MESVCLHTNGGSRAGEENVGPAAFMLCKATCCRELRFNFKNTRLQWKSGQMVWAERVKHVLSVQFSDNVHGNFINTVYR